LFSSGLRNKQYFIFNEEKSKEEYEDYFKKLKLSSYKQWQAVFSGWLKFRQEKVVFRSTYQMNCENCEGTDHANSKNLKYCFACDESEDCSYGFHLSKSFNCIDNSHMGYDRSELAYNTIGTSGVFNCFCCESSWHDNDLICCGLCFNSKDCFGSVAMRHNQYCILNKQYSKKEYDEMVPKIIERMILNGEWGQFFPRELALFGYNESVAQEYYPLEKKKALEAGWQWKDEDEKESGSGFEIPDDIGDVDDDVCEEVLICEKSGRPYKILERERSFYKKLQIPIPRLAPDQRVIERQRLRSPMKLWQRECMKCSKEHLSVFGPKCKEKIYCEKCYLEEVY